jgi:colicin import membrane protein
MRSYWFAGSISFFAHILVVLLVVKGWAVTHPKEIVKPPSYIKATLIDLKTQGKQGAPQEKPKPQKIDLEKKRLEQERLNKQKEQAEAARKKQYEKEQADKQKALKEKQQAEQRKRAEEELQRQAQAERQQLEKQRLQENMNKERELLEAEQKAEKLAQQVEDDRQVSQSYSDLIRKRIEQSWSRPPSARNDMEVLLTIQLIPTGEVVDVAVTKSSGSAAYDRSAIQAVQKVRQFPEIKQMPARVFEAEFRKFKLIFKPQDLRQ